MNNILVSQMKQLTIPFKGLATSTFCEIQKKNSIVSPNFHFKLVHGGRKTLWQEYRESERDSILQLVLSPDDKLCSHIVKREISTE